MDGGPRVLASGDFLITFIVLIYEKTRAITSRCAVTLIYSIFFPRQTEGAG